MNEIDKQVEEAFSNIDWKVEIDTKWMGREIKETLILPTYLQEGLKDNIRRYVSEKRSVSETIYVGQIGSNIVTGDKVINELNIISKKAGVKNEDLKIHLDEENENICVSYKLPWSQIKLDVLAKGEYDRVVYKYKQDYETMLRIQHTKKLADD